MDWADALVARKATRGVMEDPDRLRQQITYTCELNVKRWKGETWTAESERITASNEETARLVQLLNDEEDCEQLEYKYAQKGIYVQADRNQKGKIEKVKLPFSPEEWVDLFSYESETLPPCRNVSRVRDILFEACKNNGFIEADGLYEVLFLINEEEPEELGPVQCMNALWDQLKDQMSLRVRNTKADINTPEGALAILYECSDNIKWNNIAPETKERLGIKEANRVYSLATIQAAVHTLFFKLKEINSPTFEGFGVVHEDGEIFHTQIGLAIFNDKRSAQKLCDILNEEKHHYFTRKIRISIEKGVEYLPE